MTSDTDRYVVPEWIFLGAELALLTRSSHVFVKVERLTKTQIVLDNGMRARRCVRPVVHSGDAVWGDIFLLVQRDDSRIVDSVRRGRLTSVGLVVNAALDRCKRDPSLEHAQVLVEAAQRYARVIEEDV